jgi:hypothetical protein
VASVSFHPEGDRPDNSEAVAAATVDAIAGTPMAQDYRAKVTEPDKLQELLEELGQFDAGAPAGPTPTSGGSPPEVAHRW